MDLIELILENIEFIIVFFGYILLLATSGIVVKKTIGHISDEKIPEQEKDTGFVIGKCENILILTFMLLNAYTALALIFVAKTVVRKEDMSRNTLYFLSGSMINVTYSIMISVVVKSLLEII